MYRLLVYISHLVLTKTVRSIAISSEKNDENVLGLSLRERQRNTVIRNNAKSRILEERWFQKLSEARHVARMDSHEVEYGGNLTQSVPLLIVVSYCGNL